MDLRWDGSTPTQLHLDDRIVACDSQPCSVASCSPSSSHRTLSIHRECISGIRHIRQVHLQCSLRSSRRRWLSPNETAEYSAQVIEQLRPLGGLSRVRAVRLGEMSRQLILAQIAEHLHRMRWLSMLEVEVSGAEDASVAEVAAILQPLCKLPHLVHLSLLMSVVPALGSAGCLKSLQSLRLMGRLGGAELLEGEAEEALEDVEQYCDRTLLPSLTHLHIDFGHSLDLSCLLEQLGDQLTFLSVHVSWSVPPTCSETTRYSALQSLHLKRVTFPAHNLHWLTLFPSLTQLSLIGVGFDSDDSDGSDDGAKDNSISFATASILAGLPSSLRYLKLDCLTKDTPNAVDVELLFSSSHSLHSLTHLWVDVSPDVVDRVGYEALLPAIPSIYPHLTHCRLQCVRHRPGQGRELAWPAVLTERLADIWCAGEELFDQVRLDKQWGWAQILR